jgi:RNA-directed DNA polymerase
VQFEGTVPTVRDRVVQAAANLVLEPIFEADFEDNAYGYPRGEDQDGEVRGIQEADRHTLALALAEAINLPS